MCAECAILFLVMLAVIIPFAVSEVTLKVVDCVVFEGFVGVSRPCSACRPLSLSLSLCLSLYTQAS